MYIDQTYIPAPNYLPQNKKKLKTLVKSLKGKTEAIWENVTTDILFYDDNKV